MGCSNVKPKRSALQQGPNKILQLLTKLAVDSKYADIWVQVDEYRHAYYMDMCSGVFDHHAHFSVNDKNLLCYFFENDFMLMKLDSILLLAFCYRILNSSYQWAHSFCEAGGISVLIKLLEMQLKTVSTLLVRVRFLYRIILCIDYLVQITHERVSDRVLSAIIDQDSMNSLLAIVILPIHDSMVYKVLNIFTRICFETKSNLPLLQSLSAFAIERNEPIYSVFATIISNPMTDITVKCEVIRLINTLLLYELDVNQRLKIRQGLDEVNFSDVSKRVLLTYQDDVAQCGRARWESADLDVEEDDGNVITGLAEDGKTLVRPSVGDMAGYLMILLGGERVQKCWVHLLGGQMSIWLPGADVALSKPHAVISLASARITALYSTNAELQNSCSTQITFKQYNGATYQIGVDQESGRDAGWIRAISKVCLLQSDSREWQAFPDIDPLDNIINIDKDQTDSNPCKNFMNELEKFMCVEEEDRQLFASDIVISPNTDAITLTQFICQTQHFFSGKEYFSQVLAGIARAASAESADSESPMLKKLADLCDSLGDSDCEDLWQLNERLSQELRVCRAREMLALIVLNWPRRGSGPWQKLTYAFFKKIKEAKAKGLPLNELLKRPEDPRFKKYHTILKQMQSNPNKFAMAEQKMRLNMKNEEISEEELIAFFKALGHVVQPSGGKGLRRGSVLGGDKRQPLRVEKLDAEVLSSSIWSQLHDVTPVLDFSILDSQAGAAAAPPPTLESSGSNPSTTDSSILNSGAALAAAAAAAVGGVVGPGRSLQFGLDRQRLVSVALQSMRDSLEAIEEEAAQLSTSSASSPQPPIGMISDAEVLSQLQGCIISLDKNCLRTDLTTNLLAALPTAAEIAAVSRVPMESLDTTGQFFKTVGAIPRLSNRLETHQKMLEFEYVWNRMIGGVNRLSHVIDEINQSETEIGAIFGVALAIANHINTGHNSLGNAKGFKLGSFKQFIETKLPVLRDGQNWTLMHVLVDSLQKDRAAGASVPSSSSAVAAGATTAGATTAGATTAGATTSAMGDAEKETGGTEISIREGEEGRGEGVAGSAVAVVAAKSLSVSIVSGGVAVADSASVVPATVAPVSGSLSSSLAMPLFFDSWTAVWELWTTLERDSKLDGKDGGDKKQQRSYLNKADATILKGFVTACKGERRLSESSEATYRIPLAKAIDEFLKRSQTCLKQLDDDFASTGRKMRELRVRYGEAPEVSPSSGESPDVSFLEPFIGFVKALRCARDDIGKWKFEAEMKKRKQAELEKMKEKNRKRCSAIIITSPLLDLGIAIDAEPEIDSHAAAEQVVESKPIPSPKPTLSLLFPALEDESMRPDDMGSQASRPRSESVSSTASGRPRPKNYGHPHPRLLGSSTKDAFLGAAQHSPISPLTASPGSTQHASSARSLKEYTAYRDWTPQQLHHEFLRIHGGGDVLAGTGGSSGGSSGSSSGSNGVAGAQAGDWYTSALQHSKENQAMRPLFEDNPLRDASEPVLCGSNGGSNSTSSSSSSAAGTGASSSSSGSSTGSALRAAAELNASKRAALMTKVIRSSRQGSFTRPHPNSSSISGRVAAASGTSDSSSTSSTSSTSGTSGTSGSSSPRIPLSTVKPVRADRNGHSKMAASSPTLTTTLITTSSALSTSPVTSASFPVDESLREESEMNDCWLSSPGIVSTGAVSNGPVSTASVSKPSVSVVHGGKGSTDGTTVLNGHTTTSSSTSSPSPTSTTLFHFPSSATSPSSSSSTTPSTPSGSTIENVPFPFAAGNDQGESSSPTSPSNFNSDSGHAAAAPATAASESFSSGSSSSSSSSNASGNRYSGISNSERAALIKARLRTVQEQSSSLRTARAGNQQSEPSSPH